MTHVSWIRVVVKKCYDIVVPLLTEMALKKLKFIPGRTESTMRRMLDPPFILHVNTFHTMEVLCIVHTVPHNSNSLISNYRLFRRPPSAPEITP